MHTNIKGNSQKAIPFLIVSRETLKINCTQSIYIIIFKYCNP